MSPLAAVTLLVLGFLVGLVVRSQWKGRKVRFYPVPVPVVRFQDRGAAPPPSPVPGQRALGMEPTAVYVLSDRNDRVLYVGISNSLEHRFRQHADTKHWASQVARVSAHVYPDRYAALAAEFALIHYLRPPHNTAPSGSSDAWTEPRPPIKPALTRWPRTRSRARQGLRGLVA